MNRKRASLRFYSIIVVVFYLTALILGDISVVYAQNAANANNDRLARINDDGASIPKRISEPVATAPAPDASKAVSQAAASGAGTNENLVDQAVKTVTDPKFIGSSVGSGTAGLVGDVAGKVIVRGASKTLTTAGTRLASRAGSQVVLKTAAKVLTRAGGIASYAIPGVGPVLGSFISEIFSNVGDATIGSAAEDIGNHKMPSFQKAVASIDWSMVLVKSIGGVLGSIALTALCPPLGIVAVIGGSMIGSFVFETAFKQIKKLFEKKDGLRNVAGASKDSAAGADGRKVTSQDPAAVVSSADSGQKCPSDPGTSGDGSRAVYERMNAVYSNYTGLIKEGKGDSAEANAMLAEYKKLSAEYAKSKK